jgi:hypothetical protein
LLPIGKYPAPLLTSPSAYCQMQQLYKSSQIPFQRH